MQNLEHSATFNKFFDLMISFISVHKPANKEVLHFLGTLIVGIVGELDYNEIEKDMIIKMFNELLKIKLNNKILKTV